MPKDDPMVQELSDVLREWSGVWKRLYAVSFSLSYTTHTHITTLEPFTVKHCGDHQCSTKLQFEKAVVIFGNENSALICRKQAHRLSFSFSGWQKAAVSGTDSSHERAFGS